MGKKGAARQGLDVVAELPWPWGAGFAIASWWALHWLASSAALLSKAIGTLQAASDRVDTALIYVSDHGESLGEKGLFLHGLPYRIAPAEQTRVPMIWWLGPGLDAAIGTPDGCTEKALRKAAQGDVAHDHLFHSLLGLMDVRTGLYEARLDVLAECRKSPR